MAPTDRYRRPADLPQQIPVFPLRGVILLPRAVLPLSVFEPRYLSMLEDIVSGSRIVGVVQPERSDSDEESPPGKTAGLRAVGCAGRLTAFQELDDDRVLVTVTGVARFSLVAEMATAKPYRIFEVDYDRFSDDFRVGAGEELVDRSNLLRVLKSYLEAHKLKADWRAILSAPSEYLVNSLSVVCPYGAEEKQALLEAKELKDRAAVLMALAEMELASGESGSGSAMN
ncbi:MAG: LON peptidase substrate-binding domain-containing protein [Hyphomicrobiaceae bacterium]|nr:LON peptidase substrate-binding domain-containing protein [Hyphomicrobiaceae bacterium]